MKAGLLAVALLVSACKDERPPSPTAQESAQLNDTEDALNAMARNEEGPADRSAGPLNAQ